MSRYLDLHRRFRVVTEKESGDSEYLSHFAGANWGSTAWPELLDYRRVIVLAEAGSGKSIEMMEQARRLADDGRFAFCVPVESLDKEPLPELLSPRDEGRFEAWRAKDGAHAWFFLDAVDELKLATGRLERAFRRLAKDTDGLGGRMTLIVSCRPSDWRWEADTSLLMAFFPSNPIVEVPETTSEGAFLNALRETSKTRGKKEPDDTHTYLPQTVSMLPLNAEQVKAYAEHLGVQDTSALLKEIDAQDAWAFCRRPLDLGEVVATWSARGRLGTLWEQHELNVAAKLRDSAGRPDANVLSDCKSLQGVMRLALAMTLCRTRLIRAPDQQFDRLRNEAVLDPAEILPDWTAAERRTLLSRAIFDPATYGRVRFHNRTVQEYLSARRLHELREGGMSIAALLRLIFADKYDASIVIPSMRPISAWLALWDEDVRRELVTREPEVLVAFGDPSSLPLSVRADLIRQFKRFYGDGDWHGISLPVEQVRRLAHPQLATVVREIWDERPTGSEVRHLLMDILREGAIAECSDIARTVALDSTWDDYCRITAINALIAFRDASLEDIGSSMLRGGWPETVVRYVAPELFPSVISAQELITIVAKTEEPANGGSGFGWTMQQLAERLSPELQEYAAFRGLLARLIEAGTAGQELFFFQLKSKFQYLAAALLKFCQRELETTGVHADDALIYACVVAARIGDRDERPRRQNPFQSSLLADPAVRERIFWTELALMERLCPAPNSFERCYHVLQSSLLTPLQAFDVPWLLQALEAPAPLERREVALEALLRFLPLDGRIEALLVDIQKRIADESSLGVILDDRTRPVVPDPRVVEMEAQHEELAALRLKQEEARLNSWIEWRSSMLRDPAESFSEENWLGTVRNLTSWLKSHAVDSNQLAVWDGAAIAHAFSEDVAIHARRAFGRFWRENAPKPRSMRPPETQNAVFDSWYTGLSGLAAEAADQNWAKRLSPEEVRAAAAFAMVEFNGMPAWISALVRNHPAEVEVALGNELSAQLKHMAGPVTYPMLQSLTQASEQVVRLFVPRLLDELRQWPVDVPRADEGYAAMPLADVLLLILRAADPTQRAILVEICLSSLERLRPGPLCYAWLRALFSLDSGQAERAIVAILTRGERSEALADEAVELFGGLFTRYGLAISVSVDDKNRARLLGSLVRLCYRYVQPKNDANHDGVITPNARDNAESARNYLLTALIDTPGPETREVLIELAEAEEFSHLADRLRYLARERAASDSEFPTYNATDVRALEIYRELQPADRDGMFTIMVDRLRDLQHNISHHDFTDRRTLQTIEEESEMQRTLALRLQAAANSAYKVMREDEVADRKRTDIRLSSVVSDQKVAIEIKLSHKWTLAQLEDALHEQLHAQYLRHRDCKAGCLLVTDNGARRSWTVPGTKRRLTFEMVIEYLKGKADALERQSNYDLRIAVVGLDMTGASNFTRTTVGNILAGRGKRGNIAKR